ncbi:hypothetical protein CAI21_14495 [Alkalilimnicola ehrlichii]|uniref:DUF2946 domain-containing protein n=1 Tax=Alkalilimnicola ehrlichii TaxID=351052 RepID=A0A3E0WQ88_9GAMM|nr:DUF2946 family protein [Alkalilimnicola ehrlichii]RFA27254.1 hypothetical protein CAI21_14495 [Alkalilimnicola ehrlichii]RFA34363.1 hypothetical protein CAL65_15060 [Alkalilimnicola ehrlichii]
MDEIVRKAMAKWPQVPALYGWLGLDRRGRWLLQGKVVEREPLIDFIGRNYEHDELGRWFFQNGPQRAYIELAYTPWVLRANGQGDLETHTREPVTAINACWLDDNGSLLLEWKRGVGLLDDSDLSWAFERLTDARGEPMAEAALLAALDSLPNADADAVFLNYGGQRLTLAAVQSADVPALFGFQRKPQATANES